MSLRQALLYFLREALTSLLRSWQVSLLAVLTIAVSLFIGGSFLLVSGNLSRLIGEWRRGAKVVVYLRPGVAPSEATEISEILGQGRWVTEVEIMSATDATERFQQTFPSIADLVEGWGEEPLPASFEVSFDPLRSQGEEFDAWLDRLRSSPSVSMVDDDRDWVRQLEVALQVVRGLGVTLGGILLGAAVFTIGSVIRLTAHLYRDEIAIMRLVGATELFIRGPFYMEGLLQGLAGGALALSALYAAYALVLPQASNTLMVSAVGGQFLGWRQQLLLVEFGAAAGLTGAVASLRRESVST